jgi:hypothetical protein
MASGETVAMELHLPYKFDLSISIKAIYGFIAVHSNNFIIKKSPMLLVGNV